MGIFDPKINTNVSYTTPSSGVETPAAGSGLLALLNLGVGVLDAATPRGQAASSEPSKTDLDRAHLAGFQNGLLEVQALRRAGKENQAERLEQQIVSNAARAGLDIADTNVKAVYTTITGKNPDEMYQSPEQIQLDKIRGSAIYQETYIAAPANLSGDERDAWTLSQINRKQANALALSDQSIEWTQGKRDAFTSTINDFQTATLGVLNQIASQGGSVPMQAIDTAMLQWEQMKGQLSTLRPAGIADSQWKPVQDQMSSIDKQFEIIKELSTVDGISSRVAQGIAQGIMGSDWSQGQKFIGLELLKGGDLLNTAVGMGAVDFPAMKDITTSLITNNFPREQLTQLSRNENGNIQAPTGITDTVSKRSPEDNIKAANNLSTVAANIDRTRLTDPEYRTQAAEVLMTSFESMRYLGDEQQAYTTAQNINKIFDGSIAGVISEIAKTDPQMAENLREMAQSALAANEAIASGQLQQNLSNSVFQLDDGQITLREDAVRQRIGDDGLVTLQLAAADYYGGDVVALINDNGRRASRSTSTMGVPASDYITKIGRPEALRTARLQLDSVNALNNARRRFDSIETLAPEAAPKFEVVTNPDMNPLIGTMKGASTMAKPYAAERMKGLLEGPFQQLQSKFGAPLTVNDAIAKAGTSREKNTPGSRHFHGDAIDISTVGMSDADKIRLVNTAIELGFQGFGFGRNILHLDLGARRAWAYGNDTFGGVPISELKNRVATGKAGVPQIKSSGTIDTTATVEADPNEGQPTDFVEFTAPNVPDLKLQPLDGISVETPTTSGVSGDVGFSDAPPLRRAFAEGQAGQPAVPSADESPEKVINKRVTEQALRILRGMGIAPSQVPTFRTKEDAQRAIEQGIIKKGDLYELGATGELVLAE